MLQGEGERNHNSRGCWAGGLLQQFRRQKSLPFTSFMRRCKVTFLATSIYFLYRVIERVRIYCRGIMLGIQLSLAPVLRQTRMHNEL